MPPGRPGAQSDKRHHMADADRPPVKVRHLLHIFASFGLGGVPIRICEVINGLPKGCRHTVIALDGCFDARSRLAPDAKVEFRSLTLPKYNLLRSIGQVRKLISDLSPDLVLTYNWGAIECALANRFFPLCDHIHFESGFGSEEGDGQLWRRNLTRRIALGRVQRLVVPSETLMKIAANAWGIPGSRLSHIPNGVDLRRFFCEPGQRTACLDAVSGRYTTIIGTVAPLRPEKNVARLLRAFAAVPGRPDWALVVAGSGVELKRLRILAEELKITEHTYFLGHVDDVPAVLRGIDVFALSSDTEQMPNSLLQAMAAGRPVAAVDVGDVRPILAPENHRFVVPRGDDKALSEALAALASDAPQRATLGRLNQDRVKAKYDINDMVAAYSNLLGLA